MANSIIYKSLNTLMSVLKSEQNITSTEILELITIYNKTNCGSSIIERKNPLIVFEGLDGSGKSTIMKVLNEKINCKTVSTPPESIKHLREYFNDKPPELRRAFYSLGNYIVAEEIKLLLKESPVLMDRFWHSTCVSALANDVADSSCLPAVDSDLYQWPEDLLKPDVVIFLNVPEHIRIERLSRRKNYTAEEDRLKNDDCFRNVWFTAFERMRDPAVLKIESMATPKKCAQYILNRLTAMGLVLPPRKN